MERDAKRQQPSSIRTISGRTRDLALAALLFCLTLLAYFPALNGSLLWDDDRHLSMPALRSIHGLWRIWFDLGATQQFYPLLHSAFWIEHRLWGDAVLGYHLTNVGLHVTAALLVVAIVRKLGLEAAAWPAGFLFALHPISVEAVAWMSEQKSTLSAVFYLGSALLYLNFDRTRRRSHYAMALLLFVLALLSKSVTATLPGALLLVLWWQRGRLNWSRDVLPLVPWFGLGAASGLFTAWVERTYIGASGAEFNLTFLDRTLLAGRVVWFYLDKLLLPVNLMFFYPHWNIDAGQWWQYLFTAGIVALIGLCIWLTRIRRWPLAALLFFLATLFPVLGFLNVYPFIYSWVADHFVYLASLAVIVPVAAAASRVAWANVILVALLAMLTWREAHIYTDIETLYTETLRRNPASWAAHDNLGAFLLTQPGRLNEAIAHFEAALRLKPDSANAHNNLGSAWAREGRASDAIAEFRTAIRLRPSFPRALNNLGSQLAGTEAVEYLQKAVALEPDSADAHNNLGSALSKIPGRLPEAIAQYQLALQLDPDFAEAHNNLAGALMQTPGRMNDAIAEFEAALRARPNSAEIQSNLALALARMGRKNEAIPHFEAAVRNQPDSLPLRLNLGNTLLDMPGRESEAVTQFQAAVHIEPNSFQPHFLLGLALLRVPGHNAEALAELDAALKINPDPAALRVVDRMRRELHQH